MFQASYRSFADVPADHWANQAIAQLAADGVIEGYGDATYRGDQEITRYEVAQIVAKAMAKDNVSAANKAAIDKLAAEFANELDALGVRVSALEKKVDNVKWNGRLRYNVARRQVKGDNAQDYHDAGQYTFRIEPKAVINNHWSVKTRLDLAKAPNNAKTAATDVRARVNRAWATGIYGNTMIMLGKFPYETPADEGLVFGERISGALVSTGKILKVDAFGGRTFPGNLTAAFGLTNGNVATQGRLAHTADSGTIAGIHIYNDKASKITVGAGYTRLSDYSVETAGKTDTANIFSVGAGYAFNKKLRLNAGWSYNTLDQINGTRYDAGKSSHFVALKYGSMSAAKPGSFDVTLAYRNASMFGSIHDAFGENNSVTGNGDKYGELVANYCIDKNITFTGYFAKGKTAPVAGEAHEKFTAYWSEICFLF